MRYAVFFKKPGGKKTCVFNTTSPDLALAVMNPKVHLAADSAGTFECSLNPNSPAMSEDVLERMATKVMVQEYKEHVPNEWITVDEAEIYDHGQNREKVLFYGRLLSIDKDFYNTPSLYCEGALSFLNDTVIMPTILPKRNSDDSYFTPAQALSQFLHEHNLAVTRGGTELGLGLQFEDDITKMVVTMKDDLFSGDKNDGSGEEIENFKVETYTNTLDVLNELKSTYGGRFRVRYRPVLPNERSKYGEQMSVPILDWIADFDNTKQGDTLPDSESYIEFGKNLLDLTQKTDGSNIVNCLFLTGKKVVSANTETIGDEIDIAPMCYYWMVRDKGEGVNGALITSDQNSDVTSLYDDLSTYNIHDLRLFMNVKNGGICRDPKTLAELQAINDTDMSHIYRVTDDPDPSNNTWWVYNHNQGTPGYIKFFPSSLPIEAEIIGGNAVRVRGYESDVYIRSEWNASSRGLAWIHGCVINNVGGDADVQYTMSNAAEYSCTGYFDSGYNSDFPVNDTSLRVVPGEVYYLSNWCASDSGRDPALKTVSNITTKYHLGQNGAVVTSKTTVGDGGTSNTFKKITIDSPAVDDSVLYLNLSSKSEQTSPDRPKTRADVNLFLWRSRKPIFDEYITMYGIADGTPKWYLENEKYIDSVTQRETTRQVMKIPKRVKQLLIGVTDEEQWFCYPSPPDDCVEQYVEDIDDFDWSTVPVSQYDKVYYMDGKTGYVWTYDGSIPSQEPLMRAYKVNSYGVEDPVSIVKYGRIEKIVNFDKCTDPSTLRDLGGKTLFEARMEGLDLNVTALDLSLLENNIDSPDILDMISIRSRPHGVGEDPDMTNNLRPPVKFSLPLTERDIPLNDPSQQQYSIGYSGTRRITKTYDWTVR